MKKSLLTIMFAGLFTGTVSSQCLTSSTPFNDCTDGDQIDVFMLNNITNANYACGSAGYIYYTAPTWTLQLGGTYSWSATVGSTLYDEGFAIWIDLNNDGIYANSEQLVASLAPAMTHSGSLTIPFSASPGTVKMRVRCAFDSNIGAGAACTSNIGFYGETEDYNVTLVCPATAITPSINIVASSTLVCQGNSLTLTGGGASTYTWSGGVSNGVAFNPNATTTYTVNGALVSVCPSNTNSAIITVSVQNTPLPVSATSALTLTCNGATNTLSANGALSYTWMPNAYISPTIVVSSTTSVVYTVTGSNNNGGCLGTATVALSVASGPTVTVSVSSSSLCNGSSVTLTASGAMGYTWMPGNLTGSTIAVTPTVPTNYVVQGDNSLGCISSTNQPIVVYPTPNLTVSSSTSGSVCVGDVVTLTAGGGSSYMWSNNLTTPSIVVTAATSTTYSVTGTNTTGCSSTAVINVNVFVPQITISGSTSICNGKSTTLTVNGASSYTWNNNSTLNTIIVSPNITTTYSVVAYTSTNNINCQGAATVNVVVLPTPTVSASTTRSVICKNESTIINASGANTYNWSCDAWSQSATGSSISVTYSLISTLVFTVTGTNTEGCSSNKVFFIAIESCNGLSSLSVEPKLSIYPNPNAGEFVITHPSALNLELVNELGQLVQIVKLNAYNNYSQKISNLTTGVYFIRNVGNKGSVINQKIIVSW